MKKTGYVLLGCLVGLAIVALVCMATYRAVTAEAPAGETVQDYENYYDLAADYQLVLEGEADSETLLAVSMKETSGPVKCSVKVSYKMGDDGSWRLSDVKTAESGGEACHFPIPEHAIFKVEAKAEAEGSKNGYVTLRVTRN